MVYPEIYPVLSDNKGLAGWGLLGDSVGCLLGQAWACAGLSLAWAGCAGWAGWTGLGWLGLALGMEIGN